MLLMYYNARGHDRQLAPKDLARTRISPDSLLWINATPAEFDTLSLPKKVAELVKSCPPEPGAVRVHTKCYSLSIPVLNDQHDAEWDHLGLIVGEEWLVSLGEGTGIDFGDLIEHDVGETMKGKLSGSTLGAALIAVHFGRVHERIGSINREIDQIEERTLTGNERRNTLQIMAVLRRQVSRLRQLVDGYRAVVHTLNRPDFFSEIDRDDQMHFAHLLAGYERLEDEVARLRESLVTSFDLYATRVAQDTNRLLRTLTFITIGIGLIGAMAGVFGMNFQVDLFKQGAHGFYVATMLMGAIMAATVAAALTTYRRP